MESTGRSPGTCLRGHFGGEEEIILRLVMHEGKGGYPFSFRSIHCVSRPCSHLLCPSFIILNSPKLLGFCTKTNDYEFFNDDPGKSPETCI